MKKISICVMLALVFMLFPSCTNDTGDDGSTAALKLKEELKKSALEATEKFESLFFDYYSRSNDKNDHFMELRLLPSTENGIPQWDELTHFVFGFADVVRDKQGNYFIPTETFDNTVKRFFPDYQYENRSSNFLNFTGDGYIPLGFDDLGSAYYWLTGISKGSDGIYNAEFIGVVFNEWDFIEAESGNYEDIGKNMKAVLNIAGEFDRLKMDDYVFQLFQQKNYDQVFDIGEKLKISFMLSDNHTDAFTYLSCSRDLLD